MREPIVRRGALQCTSSCSGSGVADLLWLAHAAHRHGGGEHLLEASLLRVGCQSSDTGGLGAAGEQGADPDLVDLIARVCVITDDGLIMIDRFDHHGGEQKDRKGA